MQIGQTQDLITQADMSRFSDRVKINEGINTHRVLNGPFLTRSVYYPTLVEEQGQMTQRMKSVIVPKVGSELLRSLASTEKEFRTNMGENDPRSQFTPTNAYLYLIFNRDEVVPEGEAPKVRVAAYKQTVYNRLIEIQNERSTKNNAMLKNGLIFMYDVQIKKTVGDSSRAMYTTKYTVDVDSENNKVMGVVPADILEMGQDKMSKVLTENKIWEVIFTPEELEAIEECKIDLEEETKPNTEEEIVHKLKENPIFLGAKDGNTGRFLFPQNEQFMKFLMSKELPILEAAAQTQLPVAQPPTEGSSSPVNITPNTSGDAKPQTTEVVADSNKEIVVETSPTPAPAAEVIPEGKDQPILRWGDQDK